MKSLVFALVGSFGVGSLAGCSGSTASADPQTQTQQAQSTTTTTDGNAEAKRQPPSHRGGPGHGPPPEAFEACASKAAGDTCTVTFGQESLAGKCVTPPASAPDTRIVCRPDKMPEGHGPGGPGGPHGGHSGHPHGPPPPEVFAACDGKAADAACSVTLGDHEFDGTCKAPPPNVNETRLGCAPSRLRPAPQK